jgi:hypothetical protein
MKLSMSLLLILVLSSTAEASFLVRSLSSSSSFVVLDSGACVCVRERQVGGHLGRKPCLTIFRSSSSCYRNERLVQSILQHRWNLLQKQQHQQ